jgi:polyhydroxybutyrate depolymerase
MSEERAMFPCHQGAVLKSLGLTLLTLLTLLCWIAADPAQAADTPLQGQISHTFSAAAGGKRSFTVSLPESYSAARMYKLLLVFPGTDTSGQDMKAWIGDGWSGPETGLEANLPDTIFVYPDPNWHDFPNYADRSGGRLRGWLLGPNSIAESGYRGEHPGAADNDPVRDSYTDITFTRELIDWLTSGSSPYRIDKTRVFVTGHSWGGDMAAVVGCFVGDRIRATAPVAANWPYWFHAGGTADGDWVDCKGQVAVWTFFGLDDEFFSLEPPHDDYGVQQNDFWRSTLGCRGAPVTLHLGIVGTTTEYRDCARNLRFTLYNRDYSGDGDDPGHYPPDTYAKAVSAWFAGF